MNLGYPLRVMTLEVVEAVDVVDSVNVVDLLDVVDVVDVADLVDAVVNALNVFVNTLNGHVLQAAVQIVGLLAGVGLGSWFRWNGLLMMDRLNKQLIKVVNLYPFVEVTPPDPNTLCLYILWSLNPGHKDLNSYK